MIRLESGWLEGECGCLVDGEKLGWEGLISKR
jgi:hypothetical protein